MNHIGLFEGIGGFSLGAKIMGWETKAWCEWNPFCQRILKYHFPNAEAFGDITTTYFGKYANRIDVLTGGFPCQPYSIQGERKGTDDERHLWPEMLRAIREIKPRWIVGENVLGLVNWSGGLVFEQIQSDLENEGYEVQSYILPACGVNAPHQRDRVFVVAYANNQGLQGRQFIETFNEGGVQREGEVKSEPHGATSQLYQITDWHQFPTQSLTCGGDDGLPTQLDGITVPRWLKETVMAFGNAVVPQVVLQIFKAIEQYDKIGSTSN